MNKWKKIAIIVVWSLLIPALLVVLGFAEANRNKMICTGIEYTVEGEGTERFVTGKEVLSIVNSVTHKPVGRNISEINYSSIESRLRRNPWIADAAVFPTLTGKLCVKAWPREAVIRIVNQWDEQFYIDKNGVMFPVRPGFPARVPVASGFIATRYVTGLNIHKLPDSVARASLLASVLYLNEIITGDEVLKALVGQVYINKNREIELIPLVGNHTILLGDTSHLGRKLGKLMVFYEKVLKNKGWEQYKTINLKFENQIVCSK